MILSMVAGLFLSTVLAQSAVAEVKSLRGANDLDKAAKMYEKKKQKKVEGGIERTWDQQPPSIPHSIEKDRITLRANTCLKCHSKANFEKEKSPKVADSHFLDRNGKKLEKLSARRYFCDQCHTLQLDVSPLVDNTFQGSITKK